MKAGVPAKLNGKSESTHSDSKKGAGERGSLKKCTAKNTEMHKEKEQQEEIHRVPQCKLQDMGKKRRRVASNV